jgi:hypothetical protein
MNLAILKFHDLPYIKNGHATSISSLDMERFSSKFSDDIFALFTLFYLVKVWELSNEEQFVRPVYKYPFECKAPCIFCPLFSWNFTILSVTVPISQMTWKNQLLLRSLKWGLKHEPHHSDSFIRFYVKFVKYDLTTFVLKNLRRLFDKYLFTLLRAKNTTLLSKVRRRFFQILWPSQKT